MKKTSILSFGVAAALTLSAHAQSKLAPVSISLVRETTVGYYGGTNRLVLQPGIIAPNFNIAGFSSATRVTNANIVASAVALNPAFATGTGWNLQALPVVDNAANPIVGAGRPSATATVADQHAELSHYIVAVQSGTTPKFLLLGRLNAGFTTTFVVNETATSQSGTLRYQNNDVFFTTPVLADAAAFATAYNTAYGLTGAAQITAATNVGLPVLPAATPADEAFLASLDSLAGRVSASVAILPTGTAPLRTGKFVHASTSVAVGFTHAAAVGLNPTTRYSGGISIGKSDYVR
jgi:hypothetical protein